MRLTPEEARARLAAEVHGVLCTLHPERGPEPQPAIYAVSADGHVGVPTDTIKPKSSTRLRREDNLDLDPRGALLVENWDAEDWSRLWWVRAHLEHVPAPPPALLDELAERLSRTVPQYADRPFHRIVVCRITHVTGWSASEPGRSMGDGGDRP
jgi:hypothetical protein